MLDDQKQELLAGARHYFRLNVVERHKANIAQLELGSFSVNPFLARYLAGCLSEDVDPLSVAQALVYPRALGTSINTTFGTAMQGFCKDVLAGVFPSVVGGMDLEYHDALDGRRKYCQVKAGPNTINADDVDTIRRKFASVQNLARTNGMNLQPDDLVVGVMYGTPEDLSGHYRKIDESIGPVLVGRDFWHRLTGDIGFYDDLIYAIGEVADEADVSDLLDEAVSRVAHQVARSEVLGFGTNA